MYTVEVDVVFVDLFRLLIDYIVLATVHQHRAGWRTQMFIKLWI